ncbi:SRPBCC family protein [Fodinibius salsisoli]|uniref:SRPBCC domain-containing protein n=1 Tax=Fodinibius salsisoli TaxID=2820877 RepID=A0ABT3PIA5_9BACT|nr:SRPBCC domain-containing protein [Fodinibius salsisoli]MCW9705665.1 SRPBCC domain-containing protein [Fodinibius salsisoli]
MANIEITNYLNVSPQVVYQALTSTKGLSETWTQQCNVAEEKGGINVFEFGDESPTKFRIEELITNKKIRWLCIESDPEWVGTTVTFELEEKNGQTSVTLKQKNWKEMTEFYRWCNYNWGFFLYSLKQYCEEGKGIPFQERNF